MASRTTHCILTEGGGFTGKRSLVYTNSEKKKTSRKDGRTQREGEGMAPSATLPRGRGGQSVQSVSPITRGFRASLSFESLRGQEVYEPGNQCWALTGCPSTTVPFWSHYHKTQERRVGLFLGEAA